MANFLSDLFADASTDAYTASRKAAGYLGNARQRKKQARINIGADGMATADTAAIATMKSGDGLIGFYVTSRNDTNSAGVIKFAFGPNGIDHDLEYPASPKIAIETGLVSVPDVDRALSMDLGATGGRMEIGRPLWQISNAEGNTSYTEDPKENWDVFMQPVVAMDGSCEIIVEIDYIAFG